MKLQILGGASMWSDYSPHLADRNPRIAERLPARPAAAMRELYAQADIALAFEPLGTFGHRGSACRWRAGGRQRPDRRVRGSRPGGLPRLPRRRHRRVLEAEVRKLIDELRVPGTPQRLAPKALEARRLFEQDVVGEDLQAVWSTLQDARSVSGTSAVARERLLRFRRPDADLPSGVADPDGPRRMSPLTTAPAPTTAPSSTLSPAEDAPGWRSTPEARSSRPRPAKSGSVRWR